MSSTPYVRHVPGHSRSVCCAQLSLSRCLEQSRERKCPQAESRDGRLAPQQVEQHSPSALHNTDNLFGAVLKTAASAEKLHIRAGPEASVPLGGAATLVGKTSLWRRAKGVQCHTWQLINLRRSPAEGGPASV